MSRLSNCLFFISTYNKSLHNMEKVLKISKLTKIYRNGRCVNDISLEVFQGEIFGLLGPNGVGKTTVMKSITGLNSIQTK